MPNRLALSQTTDMEGGSKGVVFLEAIENIGVRKFAFGETYPDPEFFSRLKVNTHRYFDHPAKVAAKLRQE